MGAEGSALCAEEDEDELDEVLSGAFVEVAVISGREDTSLG
jgi:hypothetical protein